MLGHMRVCVFAKIQGMEDVNSRFWLVLCWFLKSYLVLPVSGERY
jgi:hypothetical protein